MTALESRNVRDQSDDELADDILNYLGEHPRAMDTLEGIAEWWLLRQRVRVVVERMERVLLRLAEQGTLEVVGDGPARLYCRRTPPPAKAPGDGPFRNNPPGPGGANGETAPPAAPIEKKHG